MYYLRLIRRFAGASAQNELAYRANFWISLLHSVLNLGTGVLGVVVLFGQVESIQGWDRNPHRMPAVLLPVTALRRIRLWSSPSAGMQRSA